MTVCKRDEPSAERARFGARAGEPCSRLTRLGARAQRSSWTRPVAKLVFVVGMVLGLAWVGTQSAVSAPVPPEPSEPPSRGDSAPIEARADGDGTGTAPLDAALDASSSGEHAAPRGLLPDGRVVLNLATEEELCTLRGIGPTRARQILALRQGLGRFRSERDLLRVRGIGARTLAKLRPQIVVDLPAAADSGV